MRRLSLLLLLASPALWGQATIVQGNIADPSGKPYANSSVTANFVNPSNFIANWNGFPMQATTWSTNTNSAGSFKLTLPDLAFIAPATGTYYTFTICYSQPPVTGQPAPPCFVYTSPTCPATFCVTGSLIDLSTPIQAVALPLPVSGGGGTTVPGGPSGAIQTNLINAFAGFGTFTWDGATITFPDQTLWKAAGLTAPSGSLIQMDGNFGTTHATGFNEPFNSGLLVFQAGQPSAPVGGARLGLYGATYPGNNGYATLGGYDGATHNTAISLNPFTHKVTSFFDFAHGSIDFLSDDGAGNTIGMMSIDRTTQTMVFYGRQFGPELATPSSLPAANYEYGYFKAGAGWCAYDHSGTERCPGSGGGTWGSITGTLSAQADLQAALNLKANSLNASFSGPITIDTPGANQSVLFNDNGVIGGDGQLVYNKATGALTIPSVFQVTTTWPGSPIVGGVANKTTVGVSNDGNFYICAGTNACTNPAALNTFPDGTALLAGFAATNHPELGLAVLLSQTSFAVTNVARTSNVVTVTVSTPNTALNWPVGGTISTFSIASPYTALNCSICTLTAVTGSTPTSTFTYTLAGADVVSAATTGSASIYDLRPTGYAVQFGRLESSTSNPAQSGSIRLAANDPINHRCSSNSLDCNLIKGDGADRAQLGEATFGVYVPGPFKLTEATIPSNQAGAADANFGLDPITHLMYCKEGSGGTNCMPSGGNMSTSTTNTMAAGSTLDNSAMTGSNAFKVPVKSGAVATASGAAAYDSSVNNFVVGKNGTQYTVCTTAGETGCFATGATGGYIDVATAGTGATAANGVNLTRIWSFIANASITTSTKLSYYVQTADNTSNLYNLAVFNVSGNIVCQTGATAGTVIAPSTGQKFIAWSSGCGPFVIGQRYYFAQTGDHSTFVLGGQTNFSCALCNVQPATNSATTAAVWTTPITYAADNPASNVMPNIGIF